MSRTFATSNNGYVGLSVLSSLLTRNFFIWLCDR